MATATVAVVPGASSAYELYDLATLSAAYTYENDLLTKIQTESTTYGFSYGNFGLRTSVDIGERNLAKYFYTQDGNNYLSALDYGNGDGVEYEYDGLGRVTKQTYEDGDEVTYKYDNSGALATVTDSATGRKTTYYYDLTDRMVKYVETGTGYSHSVGYEYNAENNLTSLVETINGTDYVTSYVYDDDNRLTSMTTGGTTVEYTYDDYGRVTTQVTKRGETTILTETFTYVNPSEPTTSSQIATYTTVATNYTVTYAYTYDDNGNILSVTESKNTAGTEQEYVTTYVYDSANQLIQENNQRRNKSYTWAYDNAGNVLSEKTYAYTTGDLSAATPTVNNSYTYGDEGWGDLLTAYNGTAITYDEVGNPNGYNDRTFTWEHGRQLATQTKSGVEWEYTYDTGGLRTKRSSDSKTYEYVYSGDKLVQMTITDHTTSPETVQLVELSYDAAGQPLTMTLDGTMYYYVLNIQGDVMGMVDGSGNLMLSLNYEGYGEGFFTNNTSDMVTTLASTNPLGYRGYVMDAGTGIYYLQSRYYDPNVGRFLNADALTSTGQGILGNNMFAYCGNNPITRTDEGGNYWHVLISAAISGTIALASSITAEVIEAKYRNEKFSWGDAAQIFTSVTIASAEGALVAICPSASVGICAGAAALESVINGAIDGDSGRKIVTDAVIAGGIGAAAGSMGNEIVSGKKIFSETIDAIGKSTAEGAGKLAKKTASTYIKKTVGFVFKNLGIGRAEQVAYDAMTEYAQRYVNFWLDSAY